VLVRVDGDWTFVASPRLDDLDLRLVAFGFAILVERGGDTHALDWSDVRRLRGIAARRSRADGGRAFVARYMLGLTVG
jgi:hypothetical protein